MVLNAKVNGGTPNAPTNTAASAPISTEEAALSTMIHTMTRTSQAGVRNVASASPTRTPLNPYSPAWMRPRSIPSACAASVDAMTPSVPAKPTHGSKIHMAATMNRPVSGLFMNTTCPTPRRQYSKNPTTGMLCAFSPSAGIVPSIICSGLCLGV